METSDPKMMRDCLLCRLPFQFGAGHYAGKPVNSWKGMVCNSCIAANLEGIVPGAYRRFEAHLQRFGIRVQINEDGRIDWPTDGPVKRIRSQSTAPSHRSPRVH